MNAGLNKAQCDLHHVDGEGPSLRAIVPTPFPLPWSPVRVRLCLPLPMGELHIAPHLSSCASQTSTSRKMLGDLNGFLDALTW